MITQIDLSFSPVEEQVATINMAATELEADYGHSAESHVCLVSPFLYEQLHPYSDQIRPKLISDVYVPQYQVWIGRLYHD